MNFVGRLGTGWDGSGRDEMMGEDELEGKSCKKRWLGLGGVLET